MNESILNQAYAWGFVCNQAVNGNWQILPRQKTQRWELQLVEDKWLLLVGAVPQVNLHPDEAIAFLKRLSAVVSHPARLA